MSAKVYIEGGGRGPDSKVLQIRCRTGFRRLLEKCGFKGRMPGLNACGGRDNTFGDFRIALGNKADEDYVAMLIDSEEPIADIEKAWEHLQSVETVNKWNKPKGATDNQVLFMTTCMETWVVADQHALEAHYGSKLQNSALPSLVHLETRGRHDVQDKLKHATHACSNAYKKGERSFEILAKLTPAVLEEHLPSFVRTRRILNESSKVRSAMIELTAGDLLEGDVDALVNAVNTEGVMGKGIALQVRKKFPDMFEAYRLACRLDRCSPEECTSLNARICSLQGSSLTFPPKETGGVRPDWRTSKAGSPHW